jgi:hypothetical protein
MSSAPHHTTHLPDPDGWSAQDLARLRRCQDALPTLDTEDAAQLADAIERVASRSDLDALTLIRQACFVLREATDLVSTCSGPNTAKLRHVAICRALAAAARASSSAEVRVEIARTVLALRFTPHLIWHDPDSTLGWLAIWATGHAGLDEDDRFAYAERGFPATADALRAWLGQRPLDPRRARSLAMTTLARIDQPGVTASSLLWIGASVRGELRLEWLAAWRRRVAGNALLAAEARKRGLTRALRMLCEHDPLSIRIELAHLLADLGRTADEDYLVALLPECDPAQQARLAAQLEWMGTRAALPALSTLNSFRVQRATRAAARQAIARIDARFPADASLAGAVSLSAPSDSAGALTLSSGAQTRGALSLADRPPILAPSTHPLIKHEPRVTRALVASLLFSAACFFLMLWLMRST